MAELADALDLGSSSFGSAGSIPVSPTQAKKPCEGTRVAFFVVSTASCALRLRIGRERIPVVGMASLSDAEIAAVKDS